MNSHRDLPGLPKMSDRGRLASSEYERCGTCGEYMQYTTDALGRLRSRCPKCQGVAARSARHVDDPPFIALVPSTQLAAAPLPPPVPGEPCAHCGQKVRRGKSRARKPCLRCGGPKEAAGTRRLLCVSCQAMPRPKPARLCRRCGVTALPPKVLVCDRCKLRHEKERKYRQGYCACGAPKPAGSGRRLCAACAEKKPVRLCPRCNVRELQPHAQVCADCRKKRPQTRKAWRCRTCDIPVPTRHRYCDAHVSENAKYQREWYHKRWHGAA